MAKANKTGSASSGDESSESKKPAARRAPAKKAAEAPAATAPLTALPAESAQPAKTAGKKTAAKKGGAAQPAKPAAPAGSPLVDTSLAAASAARMLAGRAKLGASQNQPQAGKESGLFKQLKQNVNKPATGTGGNTLANTFAPARGSNLPMSGGKQVAHNQTQGGMNKINIPRRTGG